MLLRLMIILILVLSVFATAFTPDVQAASWQSVFRDDFNGSINGLYGSNRGFAPHWRVGRYPWDTASFSSASAPMRPEAMMYSAADREWSGVSGGGTAYLYTIPIPTAGKPWGGSVVHTCSSRDGRSLTGVGSFTPPFKVRLFGYLPYGSARHAGIFLLHDRLGGAGTQEIDIAEGLGTMTDRYLQGFHWTDGGGHHQNTTHQQRPGFMLNQGHTYDMEVDAAGAIRWWIDGVLSYQVTPGVSNMPGQPAPPPVARVPFCLVVNQTVFSWLPGDAPKVSEEARVLAIEYIEVWQLR